MSVQKFLDKIKNGRYGADITDAIIGGIKKCYDDASVNHDNANMEVKMARGTHNTLNDRLDKSDEIQAQTNAQLSRVEKKKADKSEVGSPLVANSVAEMIDVTKVYVNTSDGKWYSHDGSEWIVGGVYQSHGIADGSISTEKTDFVESSYQYLDNANLTSGKYYWLNGLNVDVADNAGYKVFAKLNLKSGTYHFKDVIPVFSFIKNINENSVVKLEDVLINSGDKYFTVDYNFEFYVTVLIDADKAMLTNTPLPDEYKFGAFDIVIDGIRIKELKEDMSKQQDEIDSLKGRKELKNDSIETEFIKDKQVTVGKTNFIEINGNQQFLYKRKFEQGKYYWHSDGNLNVGIAEHQDYKIYPKLTLQAGVYYFTSLINVFSFVKNVENGVILSINDVINDGKIIVDYDFELYLTYSINDDNSMLTNSELPIDYVEGSYNAGTVICGYNLTELQKETENLKAKTNTLENDVSDLKNTSLSKRIFRCGSTREYPKLKDAIAEAIKYNDSYVYVDPETFDLVQEFGQDYLDNYDGREFGIHLANDVHVIFDTGSKVIFNYQGTNQKVHEFFAPFNAKYDGGGFELVNAWVESTNCRYSVHDEHASDSVPYRNIYRHCTFIHDSSNCSWGPHQAIGGGLGTYGDIVVEDCYGKAVGTDEVFSWHNAVTDHTCKSNIVVRGCYLEGSMGFGLQGSYTEMTRIFVSNCSLTRKPVVGGAPDSVVNMKLFEWNNEIRSS